MHVVCDVTKGFNASLYNGVFLRAMVHCGFSCPFSQSIANICGLLVQQRSQKGCMHTSQVPAISEELCSHCKCVEVVCSSNLSRLERSMKEYVVTTRKGSATKTGDLGGGKQLTSCN